MTERRRGLGRGLGALIPTGPTAGEPAPSPDRGAGLETSSAPGPGVSADSTAAAETVATAPDRAAPSTTEIQGWIGDLGDDAATDAGAYFTELRLADITPNPRQPRQVFEEEALAELVTSLREVGLLQPIVVRPVGADAFELIMGERRWRAAQLAGFDTIPAIVRETGDDALLLDALLENLHRAALNPLEEAAAYDQLLRDFSCTHDQLATRIGRSRSQVSNTLRLLKLTPSVQRRVAAGVISAGHARALVAVEDPADQEHLAGRIVAEGLSVRAVEELVTLGETSAPPSRQRRSAAPAPVLDDLAAALADRWDTRVKVQMGRHRGKLVVEFASVEDLERIIALMGAQAGAAAARSTDLG